MVLGNKITFFEFLCFFKSSFDMSVWDLIHVLWLSLPWSQEDNEKCDNLSSHFRGLSLVNINHMTFRGPIICQLTLFSFCHWFILFKTANPLFDTCLAAFGDILNFKMKSTSLVNVNFIVSQNSYWKLDCHNWMSYSSYMYIFDVKQNKNE